jgi:hypothetical protein
MKKIYYLLLTLAISSLSFGQEVFNLAGGGAFPTGWTATDNVTSQAIDQNTYFLLNSGDPSDIIVSAVYDLSAYSSAEFSLDVATYGSGDNNSATIEISYDGGATYTSSETTAVPTSSSYIAGGTFAVTPSAQVVIKLTNTGVAGKGNRLRNLVLTGASASPLQITTSVCATATSVRLTGPWWGWNPTGGPEAVSNNDGTWTFTFDPAPTDNMEYLLVVDGVQENLISIMANGGTCAPVTDSANYANRQWILDSGDVTNNYGQCGTTCVAPVITLLGGDETITVGDTYTDAGATASDDEQGDITGDILGITDLDTSVAGEYTVAYNVSDGALNAATEVVRTVTVEAATVTSFPYCSSFDTDLGDWSTEVTQGTSNWESASSSNNSVAAYSGGGSAYYYSGNYNGDSSVLISRPMDITALASPQVTFQIANPSWGADQDVLEVWYKATAADAWSVLGTYSDATTTFSEVTLNLPNPSNDYYIAFNATSGYGYGVLIDDVCIAEGPSCLDPTDLAVADITTTTASVSWTADSSQTAWEYQVVAGGATPAETGEATSDNPLALTGLTSNTTYDVYVRANCGTDGTSEWGMVSFTTLPDPIVPNYTNDFATFPGDLWSQAEGAIADGPSGSTSLWDTGNFAHGTNAPAAYINIYSSNRDEWLISPSFDLSGVNYYLNVDVAATEYLSSFSTADPVDAIWGVDDFVTLMVSEDSGSTWTELYRWDANNNPGVAGAAMPEIDLSAYTGLAKFAFYAESTASNEDIDFFVDNFSITSTSLGLEDVNTTSNFTYFPNPVNNVLSVKAQASIDSITVYNMLGQTVVRSTPNTTTTAVDMSGLQTGAYFVQVAINNSIETVRVIKN